MIRATQGLPGQGMQLTVAYPKTHVLAHWKRQEIALRLEGARASGEVSGSCASSQPLPDGNHGENVSTGSGS